MSPMPAQRRRMSSAHSPAQVDVKIAGSQAAGATSRPPIHPSGDASRRRGGRSDGRLSGTDAEKNAPWPTAVLPFIMGNASASWGVGIMANAVKSRRTWW